jgi:hypothetical protein
MMTVDPIRENWNLTASQLGRVRIFNGDGFEECEFEILT